MTRTARVLIKLTRAGFSVPFVALGSSMWPAIPSGSLLEIVPCHPADLAPGDVAAYENAGAIVVHRVTHRGPNGLGFKGDSLSGMDGMVADGRILGRVRVLRR